VVVVALAPGLALVSEDFAAPAGVGVAVVFVADAVGLGDGLAALFDETGAFCAMPNAVTVDASARI
jgi:hypothetical protein